MHLECKATKLARAPRIQLKKELRLVVQAQASVRVRWDSICKKKKELDSLSRHMASKQQQLPHVLRVSLVIFSSVSLVIFSSVSLAIFSSVSLVIFSSVSLVIFSSVSLVIFSSVSLVIFSSVSLVIFYCLNILC